MAAAEKLADADDLQLALSALRSLLRDAAAARLGAPAERLLNADVADRIARLAASPLAVRAIPLAEAVADAQEALLGNANKALTVDVLLDLLAGAPAAAR
jgi:hypothetical protein